jgi:hypothetical protein
MQRYQWIIWKHNAAMMVFVKVKSRLEKILEQLMAEHAASCKRQDELKNKIDEEASAQAFLLSRHSQVTNHRDKIAAILE